MIPRVSYPGMQTLHFEYGPIKIAPGQNSIEVKVDKLKPSVPGYITRFAPNLVYADTHVVPRVDVVHLHHAVWAINGYPTFAAGEEKTVQQLPRGYGLPYSPSDTWTLIYMIHDLTPGPAKVYLTYDIDLVPTDQALTPVQPLWMDVAGLKAYPVFDAPKGKARYTFPDDARGVQKAAIGPAHTFTAPADMTLVATAGHVHPGGLYTDLTARRGGVSKRLFRSQAKYFEPAGAVSWDVAMTATKPDWRIALKAGDRLNLSATYDTRKASWYESMGIDVIFYAAGTRPEAVDPFLRAVDTHGLLTHGHLNENRHHGGASLGFADPRDLLSGASSATIAIRNFIYGRGNVPGSSHIPTVAAGHAITFKNFDATRADSPQASAYHTITACRAPCNKDTGIAYPLADGSVQFDSGELGYGPAGLTPAANRNTWKTPRSLKPGTYTYFCRIHPFMRGAFRVTRSRRR
jgi:plastocyanin